MYFILWRSPRSATHTSSQAASMNAAQLARKHCPWVFTHTHIHTQKDIRAHLKGYIKSVHGFTHLNMYTYKKKGK